MFAPVAGLHVIRTRLYLLSVSVIVGLSTPVLVLAVSVPVVRA